MKIKWGKTYSRAEGVGFVERYFATAVTMVSQSLRMGNIIEKEITSSVYDCTVEDEEYIYNKLSI